MPIASWDDAHRDDNFTLKDDPAAVRGVSERLLRKGEHHEGETVAHSPSARACAGDSVRSGRTPLGELDASSPVDASNSPSGGLRSRSATAGELRDGEAQAGAPSLDFKVVREAIDLAYQWDSGQKPAYDALERIEKRTRRLEKEVIWLTSPRVDLIRGCTLSEMKRIDSIRKLVGR